MSALETPLDPHIQVAIWSIVTIKILITAALNNLILVLYICFCLVR